MASRIAAAAEAVKARLNAAPNGTFAETFTAKRVYIPAATLADLANVVVTVYAESETPSVRDRTHLSYEFQIQVGVQKRLAQGTDPAREAANAELDGHAELTEQVADYLSKPDVTYAGARWLGTEIPLVVIKEDLLDKRVMTGVVLLTLKLL